jgi:hypothetical protein
LSQKRFVPQNTGKEAFDVNLTPSRLKIRIITLNTTHKFIQVHRHQVEFGPKKAAVVEHILD